jgi:hypothetical protein
MRKVLVATGTAFLLFTPTTISFAAGADNGGSQHGAQQGAQSQTDNGTNNNGNLTKENCSKSGQTNCE